MPWRYIHYLIAIPQCSLYWGNAPSNNLKLILSFMRQDFIYRIVSRNRFTCERQIRMDLSRFAARLIFACFSWPRSQSYNLVLLLSFLGLVIWTKIIWSLFLAKFISCKVKKPLTIGFRGQSYKTCFIQKREKFVLHSLSYVNLENYLKKS